MINRFHASALALSLIGSGAHAQLQVSAPQPYKGQWETSQAASPAHPTASPMAGAQRDQVFHEDFANGLAGNNGVGAWTTAGPNGNIWRHTTTGVTGAWSNATDNIDSPSAANGFMIFASDSANTDWTSTPPAMVASPAVFVGSLVSPVLDLSATPAVEIRFHERFRFCCTSAPGYYLEVSTDGGTTWPTRISVGQDVAMNIDSDTREVAFSIGTVIAAAPSNVRFRFTHETVTHYHWQIDDVEINTLPDHELVMDYGYTSQFGEGTEYGSMPQVQMPGSINVGAGIINFGGATQNNVSVNVSVKDAANNEVANTTINVGSMAMGDTMVADADLTLPTPLPIGTYKAEFTISSDDIANDTDPNNNSKTRYFRVTEHLYALDAIDAVPSAQLVSSRAGTTTFTNNTQDVRLLNYFEIAQPATFTGVEVRLATQSQAGSYFIAAVYDTADVFSSPPNLSSPLVETDVRVLTGTDVSQRRPMAQFYEPITLQPGGYYVSANLYQENGKNIYVIDDLTVPQPGAASMLWLPVDDQGVNLYGNGNAWAIRLTSDPTIGIQEVSSLAGIRMYPSPTTGPVEIHAKEPGSMTVEVFNVLGSLVQSAHFNGTATTIDLGGNAPGIYTVRISNGERFHVQRITLK